MDYTKTEEKVKAVVGAKIPENVSELRAFLGLVNYYGKFMPNLSTVLRPLHKLLEKECNWIGLMTVKKLSSMFRR